jgi:hypothetical protein
LGSWVGAQLCANADGATESIAKPIHNDAFEKTLMFFSP